MFRALSTRRLPVLLLVLLSSASLAHAQHDTRGRVFWVTFMSNFNGGGDATDMRLYLASEVPTVARVIYHGSGDTVTVPIPQARTAVEVDIAGLFGPDVELQYGDTFVRKAIEVIAEEEITCYGVNMRELSADAFLGLPDDVLTRRYIVLAYPNGWIDGTFGGVGTYDQPSQFAIVGTEDGTTIRIDPSAQLIGRRLEPFTIMLDRGEVFNAQAAIGRYQDVSGTEIRANKPVAVFAGNRRTSIPLRVGNFRDHLVEQMPPLEVWGRDVVVTPHAVVAAKVRETAVVRVLAAFDDTKWQIDGVEQATLAHASPVEFPLTAAMHITASAPILVAQYEHSAGYDTTDAGEVTMPGDPFMMIIPPTEQFDSVYAFQSVDYPGFDETGHFVNVVIASSATTSLRLDAQPVAAVWQPTPKPGFSYAQINVRPGAHFIRADSTFGLYAYGFGPAISYGYPGGSLFIRLVHDFEPPELEPTPVCFGLDGLAFDSRITDSGIDSLYALPGSRNVTITIDPFAPGADSVRYRGRLVDVFNDGVVAVKAIDSSGRSRTLSNPIAGFTVRAAGSGAVGAIALDTLRLLNRADTCLTVTIENYGRFEQTISGLRLDPPVPGARFTTALPLVLAAGTRATVTLCLGGWADTVVSTSVMIDGACLGRGVATLPIITGVDTTPPTITSSDVSCGQGIVLSFRNQSMINSQIAAVVVDSLFNGRVVRQGSTPSTFVELELAPIDPRRDLVYQVRVVDASGNVAVRRDTIGGFTLAVLDARRDTLSERLGRPMALEQIGSGEERCDSIVLHNYGGRPLVIAELRFAGNRGLSIPPSQLPLRIEPYSDRSLVVCLEATATGSLLDTLMIADICGRRDDVVVGASVPGLTTIDDCRSVLSVVTSGAARRNFLAFPHPNPATGASTTITIGLARSEPVTLWLYDARGTVVDRLLDARVMPAGISRIEALIEAHPAGVYYLRMATPSGAQPAETLVIER